MNKKLVIQLKDIEVSQLNNACLTLIAKFVRVLKVTEGVSLRMQDTKVLLQISDYAYRSDNGELKEIYAELKSEMVKSIHHSMER